MATLLPEGKQSFTNSAGVPLVGGKLYTYDAGTNNPRATYQDAAAGVPNTNPVIMDARGEATVFWSGSYKVILKDSLDNTIWTVDGVSGADVEVSNFALRLLNLASPTDGAGMMGFNYAMAYGVGTIGRWLKDLATSVGSTFIGFLQAGVGPVLRTLQAKLREGVSAADFGWTGDGVTDDTVANQKAITYVMSTYDPAVYGSNSPANGSCRLFFPPGYSKNTNALLVTKKVAFEGDGQAEFSSGSRIIQTVTNKDLFTITPIPQGMSVSFEKLTLLSNIGGNGDLVHISRSAGTACNSQRYLGCVFGTPQRYSLNIEAGDDIKIQNNLFDSSANNAIALGTTTPADVAGNVIVSGNTFFSVNTRHLNLFNVDGLLVNDNLVYPSTPANRLTYFIDGYNTLPYQLKNITVANNRLTNVNTLLALTAVKGLNFCNNQAVLCGSGAGATTSAIELTGACTNVNITGNNISGSYDTKNFYNDAGATVVGANISGNTFVNTGGAARALVCANTTGVIANNTFIGFAVPSVSEKITTTGGAINAGLIAAGSSFLSAGFTVSDAVVGDKVLIGWPGGAFPLPGGISIDGLVTAANTVKFVVRNGTGAGINPGAFDITYTVVRGV